MGWFRAGVAVTSLAGLGLLGAGMIDCAEPTQILVEVYSDACPGSGKAETIGQTGIAVGRPDDIGARAPSALREGCETATGVGSLIIFPKDEKDEEVAIKVLAGVSVTPDRCGPAPGYAGCIAHTRVMAFVPNTTQRAVVRLSLQCLNRTCLGGTTCDNGVCKAPADLLPDGTTRPDAPVTEATVTPPSFDGGGPGAPDACAGCKGACAGGECKVDCTDDACTGEQCAPTLPCTINCRAAGKCPDTVCTTTGKCTVSCRGERSSCTKVVCNARECDVECIGEKACESPAGGGIFLDASTSAKLRCEGSRACNLAACNAAKCELGCDPLNGGSSACPDPASRPCTGADCTKWNAPQPID